MQLTASVVRMLQSVTPDDYMNGAKAYSHMHAQIRLMAQNFRWGTTLRPVRGGGTQGNDLLPRPRRDPHQAESGRWQLVCIDRADNYIPYVRRMINCLRNCNEHRQQQRRWRWQQQEQGNYRQSGSCLWPIARR